MSTWQATSLSVSPASRQFADTDRAALTFTAGEAIASATADLVILPTSTSAADLISGPITVDLVANTATVIVSGMTRGVTYELAVTFVRSDTTSWTRTLILLCVA